ncbi:MAG: carbohydrate ABC transporter permease [Clostridia bacterium]|jgi:putative aldouronate transport system permease protein|nr:carbohydrate ABC transporter permease [Clostridia bacterium]
MTTVTKKNQGKLGGLSDRTSDIILVIISVLVLLIVAYPLYYVLVASFSDPYDVYAGKTFLLPSQFTLKGYESVFAEPNIVRGYGNSILYTVLGTIYSVALIYLVAYPLSVADLPGKKIISIFFIITMYFGGGLIPTYLIVQQTGIMQTVWAMFLPGGVAVSNAIIARNYFETSIPGSLKEAASIDGASHFRIFFSMIIPLSMPILSVMVVFSMVAYWNEWFTALIYMTNEQATLPLVLRNILIKSSASASQTSMISGGYAELNKITEMIKFASIIVAAAPMLIVYPFVQKYFEKGLMAGAVKG